MPGQRCWSGPDEGCSESRHAVAPAQEFALRPLFACKWMTCKGKLHLWLRWSCVGACVAMLAVGFCCLAFALQLLGFALYLRCVCVVDKWLQSYL